MNNFFLFQFQLSPLLLVVIIGKQRNEAADSLYRLGCAPADLLLLQPQQQHPVECLETGIKLGFLLLSPPSGAAPQ